MPDSKPNLFIVGAAKCGTMSLHKYLADHPEVCMSGVKEPNFFTYSAIQKSDLYYPDEYPDRSTQEYLSLFSDLTKPVVGESSVSYLSFPGTATAIKQFNPEAKIVAMLRDPVGRARSHYLMDRRLGLVEDSLETIFYAKQSSIHFYQYFGLGLYHRQIAAYIDAFGASRVFVRNYADLGDELLADLCTFLGISPSTSAALGTHNAAGEGRFAFVRLLYQSRAIRSLASRLIGGSSRSLVKRLLFTRQADPISTTLEADLRSFYEDDITRLERLTGLDLLAWKS